MGVLLQRIFLFYFHTRFWSTCSRRHMLTLKSPTSKNSGHIYGQFDILGLWQLILPFHLYPSGCMVTKHTMELTLLTSTNSHVYSWICHFGVLKTRDCPDFWCFALILRKWLGTRACIQFYKPLLKASTWHISGSMQTVNTQLIVVSFCQNFVGTRYGTNTCGDIWIGGGSGNVVSGVVQLQVKWYIETNLCTMTSGMQLHGKTPLWTRSILFRMVSIKIYFVPLQPAWNSMWTSLKIAVCIAWI